MWKKNTVPIEFSKRSYFRLCFRLVFRLVFLVRRGRRAGCRKCMTSFDESHRDLQLQPWISLFLMTTDAQRQRQRQPFSMRKLLGSLHLKHTST